MKILMTEPFLHCPLLDNSELTLMSFLRLTPILISCQQTDSLPHKSLLIESQNNEESHQKPNEGF